MRQDHIMHLLGIISKIVPFRDHSFIGFLHPPQKLSPNGIPKFQGKDRALIPVIDVLYGSLRDKHDIVAQKMIAALSKLKQNLVDLIPVVCC